ncbi:unconventional myosin heavy chain 6-like [Varroa jacobsoni]|uniref:unconventional myosin heavy chain 6-like n=1 Tax=Varroa jacobsoni TaxID=62625 RepID=UPI000BF505CC|nr:unconventional myosin heavy chain 6-like [Varroa jacobsoni]
MLDECSRYKYLNQGVEKIEGVDDAKMFDALRLALSVLGIGQDMMDGMFSTLSAILWLGNVEFCESGGEDESSQLSADDEETLVKVANLLGLELTQLRYIILHRQIMVRGNITEIPFKLSEAQQNRHAIAKALYSRCFAWVIDFINCCTSPKTHQGQEHSTLGKDSRFLGVLDIFGFEDFGSEKNSFEQLCINYTNEKLHKFFNHYVFSLEQQTYQQEGIKYKHIDYVDNSLCLELIEKPPKGILRLLVEECRMPKGSDQSFVSKLHGELADHAYYVKGEDRRRWEREFGIRHYAGSVMYAARGFLEKNKDAQVDALFELMFKASNAFVRDLVRFRDLVEFTMQRSSENNPTGGCSDNNSSIGKAAGSVITMSRTMSKAKPTVADAFRQQLTTLVDVLHSTNPWYVRCIKPNACKKSAFFDERIVTDQLKYLGMLEIINIRRMGYPTHVEHKDFVLKYRCLMGQRRYSIKRSEKPVDNVKVILNFLKMKDLDWQIGKTKVFLRSSVSNVLEENRKRILHDSAIVIQRQYKGWKRRKEFLRMKSAACILQQYYRARREKIRFNKMRRAAVTIQAYVRGMFAREVAAALRERRKVEEALEQERLRQEKLAQSKALQEAEDIIKAAQEELAVITEMVQVKHAGQKLAEMEKNQTNVAKDKDSGAGVQVDLDQMFSFLSEVQQTPLDEKLITDGAEICEEELKSHGEASESEDPAKPKINKPTQEDEVNADPPMQNGFGEKENTRGPIEKVADFQDEMKSQPCEIHKPESKATPTNAECKDNELQAIPRTASPIKPEDTDSECNGEDDEEEPPPPPPMPPQGLGALHAQQTNIQSQIAKENATVKDQQVKDRAQANEKKLQVPTTSPFSAPAPATPSKQGAAKQDSGNHSNAESVVENAEREQRRRQRVEKKLSEMQREEQQENRKSRLDGAGGAQGQAAGVALSMVEFAQLHFAKHPKEFYQSSQTTQVMRTLTRRRRTVANSEAVSFEEMVAFCKHGAIPSAHLRSITDSELLQLSVSNFKDLCKFVRGELSAEGEVLLIQTACQLAIEHEPLRDELLVQACRQATANPLGHDALRRVWLLIAACIGCFKPSKTFQKHLLMFIRERASSETEDPEVRAFARYALNELNTAGSSVVGRRCPPSQHEVDAIRRREPLLCRLFLMDGRSKAVEVSASTTVAQATKAFAEKIGLKNTEGWIIFEYNPDRRQALKTYDYIADIIYQWELHKRSSAQLTKYASVTKKTPSLAVGGGDCRFLFKKRLFKAIREIPQDPVEVDLLYAQAVHDVVSMDYYPVVERVALQLAGLQARVILGEPEQNSTPEDNLEKFGKNLPGYLPRRVRDRRSELEFSQAIAAAYRAYGTGKSELVCKVWYLSIVMQYPLYGTTLYPVKCRGFLTYDHQMLLGISAEGVLLVNAETKSILNAYRYNELESVRVASDEDSITFTLPKDIPDIHKCYMFETREKMDIANLISAYAPSIASWLKPTYEVNVKTRLAFEDRMKLHQEVLKCRKNVVDTGLLNKPIDLESGNIFKNTLRKFHKGATKYSTLRQEYAAEGYKSYGHEYWAFSRVPLGHSLLVISDPELEGTARRLFSCILIFSGLLEEDEDWHGQRDLIQMAQWIVECGMRRDTLLNELFLQLIKQTTDHPEPNSRANVRHWQLLALLCSLVLPTQKHVLHYLHAHLKHCAMDVVTEEGQFAQFSLKCLMRTMETRGRKWPPSREEVSCTTRRHPCRTRIQFLDGQLQQVDFDPCTSAQEVVSVVKKRLNLRPDVDGYSLYEVIGTTERAMAPNEKLGDALSKWERWTTQQQQQQQAKKETAAGGANGGNEFNNNANAKEDLKPQKQQLFLFKKHLVIDSLVDLTDPVEEELIFHQLVYNVRLDRFPINVQEAVMLCSLRAQLDYGDYKGDTIVDYRKVMAQCLPMRLLKQISADAVVAQHQILAGMSAPESKGAFLQFIRSWPLWGSSIFEVQQSTTCSWPKLLWLAVDQTGLHLLEIRTRNVLCTCDYEHIVNYSPSLTSIIVFTQSQRHLDGHADQGHQGSGMGGHGQRHKGAKYIFNTNQALHIAHLIKDYVNALQLKRKPRECKRAVTTTLEQSDRWGGTYTYGKGMYSDII